MPMRLFQSLSLLLLLILLSTNAPTAAVWEVSQSGEPGSLEGAIAIAGEYDTINVLTGVYKEHDLIIDKPLVIKGQGTPVIDADGKGMIFIVRSTDVSISDLTLVNTPVSFIEDNAAILLERVANCRVIDNTFRDNFFAVFAANSELCRIVGNTIVGNAVSVTQAGNGIHLWYCKNMVIEDNSVRGQRDGIYFEFVKHSTITDNYIEDNLRYGLHFMFSDSCRYEGNSFIRNDAGVAVMYTYQIEMIDNLFQDSWGGAAYGLLLKDIKDGHIKGNTFRGNSVAVHIDGSDRIKLERNQLIDNGWALVIMTNCQDNDILNNDFVNNSFDVATNGRSGASNISGNYWSTYRGYDLDRDGFGDVAYRPVSLYSILVQANPPTLVLLRSLIVDALNLAERIMPTLTPQMLVDLSPRMRPNR